MRQLRIYSKNADYQRLVVLKTNRYKRHRYGAFFVEGVRSINQAVACGWGIEALVYAPDQPLSGWATDLLHTDAADAHYLLAADLMEELSGKTDTSELIAIVRMRADDLTALSLSSNPLLALFDRPSNHGNLGTVLRSCDALGVEGLLITGHATDLYDPEVIAASMGSFFRVPALRAADPEALTAFLAGLRAEYPGFQMVGTTAHRETDIAHVDLTRPTLLMIGNETDGLARGFKEACDVLATIPMDASSSATSLNVGCAATVLFYEAARQRRTACAL